MARTPKRPRTRSEQARKRPTYRRIFLREWLELLDKSQREVVDGTGISESHLSLIASGQRQYTQENLEKIAAFLRIEPAALLYPPADKPIAEILVGMSDDERQRAARMLRAMLGR